MIGDTAGLIHPCAETDGGIHSAWSKISPRKNTNTF
jgi:hypothetical protein